MLNNKNFYPTPITLTEKMYSKIDLKSVKNQKKVRILEPSAGKGDLIEGFKKCWVKNQEEKYREYGLIHREPFNPNKVLKFDCIEFDNNLSNILRGEGYNVIHNDFLSFDGNFYDIILMNPPFDNGCEHLLKAIRLQQRLGGQIACVLNAETLRNTYSNNRKILSQFLEEYKADIEYIEDAFINAERTTNVEIALVYLNIPMKDSSTMFEKDFEKENPQIKFEEFQAVTTKKSKIEQLVEESNIIKKSVTNLFLEKIRIDNLLKGMNLNSNIKICENISKNYEEMTIDKYYEKVDLEYWNKMINETDLMSRLPSKLRDTFRNNMESRKDIPFTLENAYYFYEELIASIPQSYEETCSNIFDKLTVEHHYSKSDWCKNIHMFNGWKTNDCFKIGKKVIIPYYNSGYMYDLPKELTDLIIIFENLSGVRNTLPREYRHDSKSPYEIVLNKIINCEKNIDLEFFTIDSYKKGTLHIKFKDMDLVSKFNIIVSKFKQWLPPSFGEKAWSDMNKKEQDVIISFGIKPLDYKILSGKQDYLRLMS